MVIDWLAASVSLLCLIGAYLAMWIVTGGRRRVASISIALLVGASVLGALGSAGAAQRDEAKGIAASSGVPVTAFPTPLPRDGEIFTLRVGHDARFCRLRHEHTVLECLPTDSKWQPIVR